MGRGTQTHEVANRQGPHEPILIVEARHTVLVEMAIEGKAVAQGMEIVLSHPVKDDLRLLKRGIVSRR
jgi:hypothetical protein